MTVSTPALNYLLQLLQLSDKSRCYLLPHRNKVTWTASNECSNHGKKGDASVSSMDRVTDDEYLEQRHGAEGAGRGVEGREGKGEG